MFICLLYMKPVIDKLPIAAGAAFDSHAEEHNPTCLPNTRVDLLREISQWIEDPDAKAVFWLNGMAGTGKSTISRTVARSSFDHGQLGASFFFKRGEGDRGNMSKFFTTIAAQLIWREPALAVHMKSSIDANPAICDKAMREQFEKLVLDPLEKLSSRDRKFHVLVIVIDALDECDPDEDIKLLIRLLSRAKASKSQRLRIFLTSRPELPIQLGFNSVQGTYQDFLLHKIPEQVVKHDLSIYFEHELANIRDTYNRSVSQDRQLSPSWPKPSETQILVQIAIPLFIFAVTVCRFLADRKGGNPNQQLQTVLLYRTRSQESKFDATYFPVLNRMLDGLSQREKTKPIQNFRVIVGSIVILASPLSTSALERMLNIAHSTIETRLDWLHSVLSVPLSRDVPVRLLHLSFRDFLLDPEKQDSSVFWVNEKETHKQLAANCLRVMNERLCTDICQVKWPGTLRASINPQRISDHLPPEVQYACQHWVYHIQQAGDVIIDNGQVHYFLQQHFLHWLEVLSLMGRASESLQNIGILQSLLQSEGNSQVVHFINDALHFAHTNILAIQATPLQAYCSALVFTPEKSIIRNTFDIPGWISLRPQVNTDWSSCLRTVEGHTDIVRSVAFAPDGKTLRNTFDIPGWISPRPQVNTDWSSCLRTFEGHTDWVRSVAFAPNSNTLASASSNCTVRVWSASTGMCLQTLEGHTYPVRSVAFAPDSKTLALASDDHTVRIWSASTGMCLQTLEGHTDWVRSVAFAPNSKTLASASDDHTVRVWSASTGMCLQTLEGHTDPVRSVAFAPDSKTLASASDDHTVRVWSASTGICLQTLEGHDNWVRSVVFAPDSKTLASASNDKTVRVWSADIGDCLQSINLGTVSSMLSFSPDGRSLLTEVGAISLGYLLQPPLVLTLNDSESCNTLSSVQASPAHNQRQERRLGYGVSRDRSWITFNGKDLLLLPADCRPGQSAVFGTTVAIGTPSGRIVIMRFSAEGPAGL
ncbi:hypothetical protein F4802DRAFT_91989 [Xylaria palmicola]|nr:hypothetical protein F4802DRAFT_91989 [Xylaria palmicola]